MAWGEEQEEQQIKGPKSWSPRQLCPDILYSCTQPPLNGNNERRTVKETPINEEKEVQASNNELYKEDDQSNEQQIITSNVSQEFDTIKETVNVTTEQGNKATAQPIDDELKVVAARQEKHDARMNAILQPSSLVALPPQILLVRNRLCRWRN